MSLSDSSVVPSHQENICNVCFEPLGKMNRTTTPCGHEFCFKCIIQAYKHNPVCPCCRTPFNESTDNEVQDPLLQEDSEDEDTEDEEDELHWRHGRKDEDSDCYCYPAIIESIKDFISIMRILTGECVAYKIRIMMKLIDPLCKFGEGEEHNWANEYADEGVVITKDLYNIYVRSELIKRFAEKHIGKQYVLANE